MAAPALYLVGHDSSPAVRTPRVRGMAPHVTLRTQLQGCGLDPKSVDTYYRRIIKADAWCTARGSSLAKAPGPLVARYADTLPRSWATRKELRAACKWYWQLTKRREPPLTFIRVPPKPTMVCKAFEESDAMVLAKVAGAAPFPEGLALTLGLYQALRREEIATLPWASFGQRLKVIGKGEKERNIHVHPKVTAKLDGLERVGQYVFPGRFGDHVSPATVWSWIRKLGEEVGLHVTPHMLRHTCLATQHDNTGNLLAVMNFAGHSRPETTSGYTRTKDQAMYAAMMSVDYLGERARRKPTQPSWPSLFDDSGEV
jgi:integrase